LGLGLAILVSSLGHAKELIEYIVCGSYKSCQHSCCFFVTLTSRSIVVHNQLATVCESFCGLIRSYEMCFVQIGIFTADNPEDSTYQHVYVYYEEGAILNGVESSDYVFSECDISWSNDCAPTALPSAQPSRPTLVPTPLPTYAPNSVPECNGMRSECMKQEVVR